VRAPEWQWNEFQQVGTDYADVAEVEQYDARMGTFRDVEAEIRRTMETLALSPGSRVLEIGCGTGRFARAAATAGHQVTAVDISPVMLEYVTQKATEEGLTNLETQHAGFLSMDLPADRFDAVVSTASLHHLPDLWKTVALENVCRVLKPAGQFILGDVVFSSGPDQATKEFDGFVGGLPEAIRPGAAQHVAKEYSTLDWIMEGLLQRAGFEVLSSETAPASFIIYHCRRAATDASRKSRRTRQPCWWHERFSL
jgi:putative AdoMet-dependent methyltransferase